MASKRNIRRRQCAGKLGYTSLTDAIHASQFGQRRYGWQRLNAYHCAGFAKPLRSATASMCNCKFRSWQVAPSLSL
jgi:hypothetical protein